MVRGKSEKRTEDRGQRTEDSHQDIGLMGIWRGSGMGGRWLRWMLILRGCWGRSKASKRSWRGQTTEDSKE